MKIETDFREIMELDRFAEKYDLTLEVVETKHTDPNKRFYAHLKYVEIKRGGVLDKGAGWGETPLEAVRQYVKNISDSLLVYRAEDKDLRTAIEVANMVIPVRLEQRIRELHNERNF